VSGVQAGTITRFTFEYVFVKRADRGEAPKEIPVRREELDWPPLTCKV
jgi:hypothetical protein